MKNGQTVWHLSRTSTKNATAQTFAIPVEYTINRGTFSIQPASGYMDMMTYGEQISKVQNGIARPLSEWIGKIKEGDRFYVQNRPVEADFTDTTGKNADYVVDGVFEQNLALRFTLKKRTK